MDNLINENLQLKELITNLKYEKEAQTLLHQTDLENLEQQISLIRQTNSQIQFEFLERFEQIIDENEIKILQMEIQYRNDINSLSTNNTLLYLQNQSLKKQKTNKQQYLMKCEESSFEWKDIDQAIELYPKYEATQKRKQKAMPYLKMAGKYLQYNPLCFVDCLNTNNINNFIDALYQHPNSKPIIENRVIQYWSLNHREELKRKLLPLTFCGLTMSLLQELRLLLPLNDVLPTVGEMVEEKHKLRQILLKFEPELTTHGMILNHDKVLTEAVLTHNLENQSFLITCFTLDACSLAHHNSYITTGGIKIIAPKLPNNQSKQNCYKTFVYYDKDNTYYLSRNSYRINQWIREINTNNNIFINNNKTISTEVILIANWILLQNITNTESIMCHYTSI